MAARAVGLHLLAPVAVFALLAGTVIALRGPSEGLETSMWAVAFAIALPAGLFLAGRQVRALAPAQRTSGGWAVALATLPIAAAMVLRDQAGPGRGAGVHAAIAVAGLLALAIPFALARAERPRRLLCAAPAAGAPIAGVLALALLAWPFTPPAAVSPGRIAVTLALAAVALALVLATDRRRPPPAARRAFDVVALAALSLVVLSTLSVTAGGFTTVHHHDFFLGPANDVLHGRTMLVDVFSQYGVGDIYALALAFQVIPIGYGGLALIIAFATVGVYALMYLTLRAAIDSPLLVACGVAVAVMGNVFLQGVSYLFYPSIGPLRFGPPYVLIACAVLGARNPRWAPSARVAGLATLAVAAVWSVETFVYCATVYAALTLLEAYGRPGVGLRAGARVFLRRGGVGLAVATGAIAALSLATLLASGHAPNWSGYLDYLALYSGEGLGQVPIDWTTAGPVAACAILLSAAGVVWVARNRHPPDAVIVALTGFTAFAIASFPYYLGRSVPTNLLHLLPPIVASGTLWTALLLRRETSGARRAPALVAALLLVIGASIAVAGMPDARRRWSETAMSQAISYVRGDAKGTGLLSSLRHQWDQPVADPRSPDLAYAIDRLAPGHGPVLLLTEPDLTTEALLRAGRRNVLPIANATQDDLVASSDDRVRASVRRVRAGTLLITSAPTARSALSPIGGPSAFTPLQLIARDGLLRRFRWHTVERLTNGLRAVRLQAR